MFIDKDSRSIHTNAHYLQVCFQNTVTFVVVYNSPNGSMRSTIKYLRNRGKKAIAASTMENFKFVTKCSILRILWPDIFVRRIAPRPPNPNAPVLLLGVSTFLRDYLTTTMLTKPCQACISILYLR